MFARFLYQAGIHACPARAGAPAPTFLLVSEGEIQPGCKDNVICLEGRRARRLRRRIGHIDIAERILPCQPLADLSHGAEIESRAILPGFPEAKVGKEFHLLLAPS